MFYNLVAECYGVFGRKVLYGGELTDRPANIYRMDFEFHNWPEDELVELNCNYLITDGLTEALKALEPRATGVVFDSATTSTTFEFRQANPNKVLPEYKWMKVIGKAGTDDFGMSKDHVLVVSERALMAMKPKMGHCKTSLFIRDGASAT